VGAILAFMKNRFITSFFCVYFIFTILLVNGQTIEFPAQHFSIENGLPSNTVYDVYQDDDGFIWIGTDKGVARYNGRRFEIFTTADGLSDNECFFFRKDYEGRLWLITSNGELCYYKEGVFHTAANTPFLELNSKASLTFIFKLNKDSTITFTLNDDPGFFEIKGEKITHYTYPSIINKLNTIYFREINKTSTGNFELFSPDKKAIYNIAEKKFWLGSYGKLHFTTTFPYNDSEAYFTDGISIYNKKLQKIMFTDPSSLKGKFIYKMYEFEGIKISATNKGIIFDGKFSLLEDNDIYALTKDNSGNYWISTAKNGIYKISSEFLKQRQVKLDAAQPVIYAYKTGENILYTTNDRNIFSLDLKTNKTKQIFDFTRATNKIRWAKSVSWAWKNNYYNFSQDQNFKVTQTSLAGNFKVSKIRAGDIAGSYEKFDVGPYIFLKSTYNLFFYNKSNFETNKDTITRHSLIKKEKYKIYGAAVDENQKLWFSLNNEVYKVDDTIAVVQPQFSTGFRELVFFNHCFVGITPHNELIVYDNYNRGPISSKVIKSNNCVWGKFYIVNDTVLLISTSDYFRVLRIERIAGKISFILKAIENPLIPYQPDYLMTDSTSCYFFRQNTLNVFPISYLLEKAPLPEMRFRLLKTKSNSLIIKDTLRLNYAAGQNIRILYTAVSYNSSDLTYEYSITSGKGNKVWFPIDGEELNLIKLNYGGFNINIRTKLITGEYSKPVSFYLIIDKPYWATWWFISACTIIFAYLLFYFVNLRVKSKLKKKESEIRFLKSEYKALNAMMNPHFIFNSLNSVQGLVNNNEVRAASKYIRIFSDLIRQNMHNVNNELIPLEKEMELVENYIKIEQLRLNNTLQYHIAIQPHLEIDFIMVPPLLIQPLVENAIKHGIWPNESENGRIEIDIFEKGGFIFIDIRDNGKGLTSKSNSDTNHQSYAITNLQKRFDQLSKIHNTKMTIEIKDITDGQGNIRGVRSLVSVEQNS
jgi:flagellar biosynthesis regulator FlbT